MSQEERFVEIEIKLAQQEDLVDALNQMVYQQNRRIDQLESALAQLARRSSTGDADQSGAGPMHERPPHY